MKHIATNFLNVITPEEFTRVKKSLRGEEYKRGRDGSRLSKRKNIPNSVAYLITTKDVIIKGFPHIVDGVPYTFPEPNPTLIFFSSAQRFRRAIETIKLTMLPKLNAASTNKGDFTHEVYNYYGAVCGTVIFLSTSLESFMNSLFEPKDIYIRGGKERNVPLNSMQIQKSVPFDEKIKLVIPSLRKKDFYKDNKVQAALISDLQEFRNNIIHTKTKNTIVKHDYVIKKSLKFNYDETIKAVADYMNYYKPDTIVECNCGEDY